MSFMLETICWLLPSLLLLLLAPFVELFALFADLELLEANRLGVSSLFGEAFENIPLDDDDEDAGDDPLDFS